MAQKDCGCGFQTPKEKLSRQIYEHKFQPHEYLKFLQASFPSNGWPKHSLQCYHKSFESIPRGVRVLDYGAGPVILSAISAATKASEIVFADYSESNRKYLRQWLQDCQIFDWSPYFRYVVEDLEGKGDHRQREIHARKLVKAVVHCDITQDPPIERGYDEPYDVLICSLVLEGASSTKEEYRSNAAKLARLVKPGGVLLYYSIENKNGFYKFGNECLPNVHICNACMLIALKDAGFTDSVLEMAPTEDSKRLFRFVRCKRTSSHN